MPIQIGIIGDYNASAPTHQATTAALQHAAAQLDLEVDSIWLPTDTLEHDMVQLEEMDGLWCAPGSPYRSMQGALQAIRFAREQGRPFLGTCGGFQHAVIEYARHVLGYQDAAHAETDPYASTLFISALSCSLAGKALQIQIDPASRVAAIYGQAEIVERYYCNFGVNPDYQTTLHNGGLRVVGIDNLQEARIVELPAERHPFFLATLFVPQMQSTAAHPHPLIIAYVRAAAAHHARAVVTQATTAGL